MGEQRTISGRKPKHAAPGENLKPGESIRIQKPGGKVFELRRVDQGQTSIIKHLEELIADIPNPGPRAKTDLARMIIEDRE